MEENLILIWVNTLYFMNMLRKVKIWKYSESETVALLKEAMVTYQQDQTQKWWFYTQDEQMCVCVCVLGMGGQNFMHIRNK